MPSTRRRPKTPAPAAPGETTDVRASVAKRKGEGHRRPESVPFKHGVAAWNSTTPIQPRWWLTLLDPETLERYLHGGTE